VSRTVTFSIIFDIFVVVDHKLKYIVSYLKSNLLTNFMSFVVKLMFSSFYFYMLQFHFVFSHYSFEKAFHIYFEIIDYGWKNQLTFWKRRDIIMTLVRIVNMYGLRKFYLWVPNVIFIKHNIVECVVEGTKSAFQTKYS